MVALCQLVKMWRLNHTLVLLVMKTQVIITEVICDDPDDVRLPVRSFGADDGHDRHHHKGLDHQREHF